MKLVEICGLLAIVQDLDEDDYNALLKLMAGVRPRANAPKAKRRTKMPEDEAHALSILESDSLDESTGELL